ncbi:hypothetical protein F4776DRAFT_638952 [Hypoxylon sp. NC0597]|nr:hypothetical protein F4776DRAFT_638952 [Hypoxylon sp. NC0597]
MADPNRIYRHPQYDSSRIAQRIGGGFVLMPQIRQPEPPAVQSDRSSAVSDSSTTLSVLPNQAANTPTTPGERPSRPQGWRNLLRNPGHVPMGIWPIRDVRNVLPPEIWRRQLEITGASENYEGNIFLPANQSASIPSELSTSLWLTNLPPDCTHQLLLGSIRGCGKIYATVINPPVHTPNLRGRARHITSAAKLVFFDRPGVDRLLAKSILGRFSVGGYVPHICMNRVKSASRPPSAECRVLHIEGHKSIVNEEFLNALFQSKFVYELELIKTISTQGDWTRQEWRFGSYRSQAQTARKVIAMARKRPNMTERERQLWDGVQVHFGIDPCA